MGGLVMCPSNGPYTFWPVVPTLRIRVTRHWTICTSNTVDQNLL